MTQGEQRCENCRFWECGLVLNAEGRWLPFGGEPPGLTVKEYEEQKDDAGGVCRRYPPQGKGNKAQFPAAASDDWCGEWQQAGPQGEGAGHTLTVVILNSAFWEMSFALASV